MENKHNFIDFHSHILPCMDDGAKDIKESINMLETSKSLGIDTMVATPHFYPNTENLSDFLERREKSKKLLLTKYDKETCPEIYLGAEVAYYKGIGKSKKIQNACILGTDYLLLEMPFEKWTSSVVEDVLTLKSNGINPIIAHIDRYDNIWNRKSIAELFYNDILIQMNCEYIVKHKKIRKFVSMVEDGMIQVVGSDSHNTKTRTQNLHLLKEMLDKNDLGFVLRKIKFNGNIILDGAIPIK